MPKAIDINTVLNTLTPLRNRDLDTSEEEASAAFANLHSFNNGAVFTGSFDGVSQWERHRGGDELVHILKGETSLTILSAKSEDILNLKEGMMTVVPQGCWHRFHAPDGVTVLTVTPQPTDHSTEKDPR
ncbi:cupin domain-containing protein [Sneathiella sp. CAU 1612]|uniref:Cupin domain-containing protein n=1 Tax=Sneathiella sedimenti TaxID=2816034 RepID=A0ABS3F594_9PROT|nr:cupin domain-containing protein [Sneathiella sedimenti]MBO0333102.1 cupin domain-containing protein [Sneathiella sedimenti]